MSLATAASYAVAQLRCDEASGDWLDDINGYNFTFSGSGSSSAETGKFDGARRLMRSNSQGMSHASNTDFVVGDNDYTIWFWFKPNSSTADQSIANKSSGSNASYFFTYRGGTSDKAEFVAYASSGFGGGATATSTDTLTTSDWNLCIAKHDAAGNLVGVSLNGAAFDTVSFTGPLYDGGEAVSVGYDPFGNYSDADFDDGGFIKGYAFSDADAAALWDSGTGVAFADWDAGGAVGHPAVKRMGGVMHAYGGHQPGSGIMRW